MKYPDPYVSLKQSIGAMLGTEAPIDNEELLDRVFAGVVSFVENGDQQDYVVALVKMSQELMEARTKIQTLENKR